VIDNFVESFDEIVENKANRFYSVVLHMNASNRFDKIVEWYRRDLYTIPATYQRKSALLHALQRQ